VIILSAQESIRSRVSMHIVSIEQRRCSIPKSYTPLLDGSVMERCARYTTISVRKELVTNREGIRQGSAGMNSSRVPTYGDNRFAILKNFSPLNFQWVWF
jgi:hypothetical protein